MGQKCRFIYKPEGGSARSWEFDLASPAWDIAYGTEKATGWPWEEFCLKLSAASAIALRALVFVLRKRTEPRLTLDAVEVTLDEIDLEVDQEEEVDSSEVDEDAGDEAPKAARSSKKSSSTVHGLNISSA